jgi:hypothetical protein
VPEDRVALHQERGRRSWPIFLGLGLLVILAGLAGAAYLLHWPPFDAATEPEVVTTTPPSEPATTTAPSPEPATTTPETPPASETQVAPEPEKPAEPATQPAPSPPARAFTEEEVRRFLDGNPDAPSAVAEAQIYMQAGHPDLALLIYRHAERNGDPAAATAIGRMYDPEGFSKESSAFPAPDADQAASYYQKGVGSGDAEAQYLLGRVLVGGKTSGATDVEQGVVWLERAAKAGSAAATELLAQLKAKTGGSN